MKSLISSSEQDIGKFREQFGEIQENHKQQREAMIAENDALREESAAIKRQRDIVLEESALLKGSFPVEIYISKKKLKN